MTAAKHAIPLIAGTLLSAAALVGVSKAGPGPTPARTEAAFLGYQARWIHDESPVAMWEKSRRIGADWTEALRAVRERMSGVRNVDYWYSSADESAAVEFMQYVRRWAVELYGQVLELIDDTEAFEGRDVRVMSVTLPEVNGRRPRITAMASSPKAFRSKGGDVCISEMAFHTHAEQLWKAAAPVTMWGGRIRVISTHHGVGSLFNRLLTQANRRLNPETHGQPRATDLAASVHRVTIYDAINDGLVERINAVTGQHLTREEFLALERSKCGDELVWREEYECVPSEEAESYFPFDLLRQVASEPGAIVTRESAELVRLTQLAAAADEKRGIPAADAVYAGSDVGRRSDLFTVWVLVQRGGMRRTAAVYGAQDMPFDQMEAVLCALMDTGLVRRMAIDATGLGMQLAERMQQRYRNRIEPVTVTATVKEDLVTTARRDMEERTVTLPDDIAILGEYNGFKRTVTSAGNVRYAADANGEGHADHAFAGMLALHAAKRRRGSARMVGLKGGAYA